LPGVFKKGAKKVSVADDRMDYYTVRAAPASAGHDSRSTQVAVHAGLTGINDSFHMNGPCPERFETPLRRCTRVCSLRLFFVLVVVLAIGDLRMKATHGSPKSVQVGLANGTNIKKLVATRIPGSKELNSLD